MPVLHAIILGIVQGLTEFLPVSSSGHLQIVPWLFGWDDFAGDESLETSFDVALHLGTLTGVIAYLWRDLRDLTVSGVKMVVTRNVTPEGRKAWLLMATIIPAGIVGVVGEGLINALDDDLWLTGITLIVFGVLLGLADRLGGERPESEFGRRDAVALGLAQACALQPGVSRSGVTITAARALKFEREAAARLVFLMSVPIIAAAGAYKTLDVIEAGGIPSGYRAAFLWGTLASAITGWVAVWFLLRWVRSRTFMPFVIYRILLGLFVLALVITGVR